MNGTTPTTMAPEVLARLDRLRDIRLPEPIGWWPLAPGWWLLCGLLLAAIIGALAFALLRRRTLRYAALRELDALKARYLDRTAGAELATRVSALLRRVALGRPPARDGEFSALASVHTQRWEAFLCAEPHGMPAPVARYLATAPYRPANDSDYGGNDASLNATDVLTAAASWIRSRA